MLSARALNSALRLLPLLAVLSAIACSARPAPPAFGLPYYGAEDASLLDDGFSGHLFATAFVPGNAGEDTHFADRIVRAESIWLVKVATVSREGSQSPLGDNRRYGLSFKLLQVLAGPPPTEPISLTISSKGPAFHWLDRVEGAWVGHEVLLLMRHYRQGDEVGLHFHGEPNSPALRAQILQIRRARAAER